jgi:voltage-gated potassium channel
VSLRSRKKTEPNWLFIFKEISLGVLGVLSVILVLLEFLGDLSPQQIYNLSHVDFAVACVFLFDFALSLGLSKDRRSYFRHNWYFLLAAIPLTDALTESLRGLRVLSLVRLVRMGGHLGYGAWERRRNN